MMKVLIIFTVVLATAAAANLPAIKPYHVSSFSDEVFGPEGRIIGGVQASLGQFPYQVALLLSRGTSSSWCGGSLISEEWVLTAAHCTYQVNTAIVYLGAVKLNAAEQVIVSTEIYSHADYNPVIISDDIALIKLSVPAKLSENIEPVVLPKLTGTYSTYQGDTVIASGWGKTSDDALDVSEDLYYIFRSVDANSKCATVYGANVVKASNICVGTVDGDANKSTCNGDSGGPLVLNDYQRTQIGLTSYGAASGCEKGHPVVFTRVTSYLDWIKNISGVYSS